MGLQKNPIMRILLLPVEKWNEEDVQIWVSSLTADSDLVASFEKNKINGAKLIKLDSKTLEKQLGMSLRGDRYLIEFQISELKKTTRHKNVLPWLFGVHKGSTNNNNNVHLNLIQSLQNFNS
eukprot:TRINITY_DN8643_c0_g1_i1.p1 TRINITY_DN8643_c0_g1~~TRINITY_DN8643_c0_g1_i1.p1  ORF type:complete len:122 (+),score=33.59 TRINITY_DN8643_c0_g1_i1:153-518(+)